MLKTDRSTVPTLSTPGQGLQQQWACDPFGGFLSLKRAMSQLRRLSITQCDHSDVPGLLGTLAASCTRLTHLELCLTPWPESSEGRIHGLLRALDQLSSLRAFPALQRLSVQEEQAIQTSEVSCMLLLAANTLGSECSTQVCDSR
jgi:hypothetical protein